MQNNRSFRGGAHCYQVRTSTAYNEIKAEPLVPGELVKVKAMNVSGKQNGQDNG